MNREQNHTYKVAISPDLDITAEEFASAWNAGADTHNLATAHFVEEKASQFIDPTLLGALLSIPAGITTMEIYDLIKSVIERVRKEYAVSATNHGLLVLEWRPGEIDARSDVVFIGRRHVTALWIFGIARINHLARQASQRVRTGQAEIGIRLLTDFE